MRTRDLVPLLLTLLAPFGGARGQDVQVLASVTETTIGTQETVAYTLEVRGAAAGQVQRPEPPDVAGLVIAQSYPSTQTNMSWVNGQMSQSIAFTWIFRPLGEGEASFGRATVRVGDNTLTTDPIRIEVVPQSSRPQRQSRPPSRLDPFAPFRSAPQDVTPVEPPTPDAEDLFIRVVPSTRQAVLGQQVALRYELYFREGIQLRQSRLTDSWDAEGFWREELDVDARPVPRVVVENSLRYNTITLKRAAVFPTRAGDLSIDPLRIESEAVLPSPTRDPFGQFFSLRSRFTPVELASAPLSVTVSPLPDEAPESFQGAVGRYRMSATFDRTTVPIGTSLQLTVTLSGTGNIATLASPSIAVPGAFEQYDPHISTNLDRSGDRLRGSKTFQYVYVPRSNGEFVIPAIEFSFFDPSAGRYVSLSSDATTVRVTGSPDSSPIARATAGGLPVDDIAGPQTGEVSWIRTDRAPLHRRAWPYLLLLIPAATVVGLTLLDRRSRHLAANPGIGRLRRAHPLARRHLKRAGELLGQGDEAAFYEELSNALLGFIGNRLNVAEQGLTRERLEAMLAAEGVPLEALLELHGFLDSCDEARFAPVRPTASIMASDHDRAGRLLVILDDSLSGSP